VDGGLISYGFNLPHHYCQAASYVDKILRGANTADLPVEQPLRFDVAVNLKTAGSPGLTIPEPVLLQATERIPETGGGDGSSASSRPARHVGRLGEEPGDVPRERPGYQGPPQRLGRLHPEQGFRYAVRDQVQDWRQDQREQQGPHFAPPSSLAALKR
jgi:hypothetical protein